MTTMTESYRVRQINALIGERYRNTTSGRTYRVIDEMGGVCSLEGIDRHVIDISRKTLESSEVWSRIV